MSSPTTNLSHRTPSPHKRESSEVGRNLRGPLCQGMGSRATEETENDLPTSPQYVPRERHVQRRKGPDTSRHTISFFRTHSPRDVTHLRTYSDASSPTLREDSQGKELTFVKPAFIIDSGHSLRRPGHGARALPAPHNETEDIPEESGP